MTRRRRATHAGSWYDSSSERLNKSLASWLEDASVEGSAPPGNTVHAVIAPHAGYSYSGPTAAYAYAAINPDRFSRVFILGPSHHVYLRNKCAVTDADALETPIGTLPVDRDVVDGLLDYNNINHKSSDSSSLTNSTNSRLSQHSSPPSHQKNHPHHHHYQSSRSNSSTGNHINNIHNINRNNNSNYNYNDIHVEFVRMNTDMDEAEHSIEMHLPYVRRIFANSDVKVVPIVVGALSEQKERDFGRVLSTWLGDGETFFVISSDFCHWGTRFRYTLRQPDVPIWRSIERLDREGMTIIESGDHSEYCRYQHRTDNTICGRHPIGVLMSALTACSAVSNKQFYTRFVRYKQSSRCTKISDSSVSYASALIYTKDDQDSTNSHHHHHNHSQYHQMQTQG